MKTSARRPGRLLALPEQVAAAAHAGEERRVDRPAGRGQISGVRRRSTKPPSGEEDLRGGDAHLRGRTAAHRCGVGVHERSREPRHGRRPGGATSALRDRRARPPTTAALAAPRRGPASGPGHARSSPAGSARRWSWSRRSRSGRRAARSGRGSHRGRLRPTENGSLPTGAGRASRAAPGAGQESDSRSARARSPGRGVRAADTADMRRAPGRLVGSGHYPPSDRRTYGEPPKRLRTATPLRRSWRSGYPLTPSSSVRVASTWCSWISLRSKPIRDPAM